MVGKPQQLISWLAKKTNYRKLKDKMPAIDLLHEIKFVWINKVLERLAKDEVIRAVFEEELITFFNLLEKSLITGDPTWLNDILEQWIYAQNPSNHDQPITNITKVLNQILLTTYEVIEENLNNQNGWLLFGLILPVFTQAISYTTRKETELHVNHVLRELETVKNNLEKLDRSKSDFIAVAAHELKTPLTLIEGYASMLIDYPLTSDLGSLSNIYLNGMRNGIRRLQEIINDMIDVSMIDNNLLKLNFQPVWINKLLEIVRHELTQYVNERSQTLKINDFDGSNQMTYGDPERLYQAFRNLLTNAIKFTPDGGKITVDGRRLPGFVEITVMDTGIGIDEAFHEQIFEKFGRVGNVQLHSSGKIKFKGGGPGLGLPITKGLIEAHGGAIWVESDGYDEVKCPGTTFHVLLPLVNEPPDKKIAKLFPTLK